MVGLFIIGNGFDLRHGLETKYQHFRKYLEVNHPEEYGIITELFTDENDPDLLWSSFEEALGRTSNINIMEVYEEIMEKIEGVDNEEAFQIIDHDYSILEEQRDMVPRLILEWITFEESKAFSIERIRGIHIDSKDYLLIFNYTTKTIELYTRAVDIRQCFIHNNIVGKNPIVGHNNPYPFEFDVDIRFPIDEKTGKTLKLHELYTPEEWLKIRLNRINKKLYKNPSNKIDQKDLFFEEIETVKGITVLGWSLGSIDIPYMDAVMEHTRPDIPIIIIYYDQETRDRFERYFENRPNRACHVRYMTWDEYETRDV